MPARRPHHLPHLPWPAYAYLPGRDPHPLRDERGHAYGQPEPAIETLDPVRWAGCTSYLRGVDLYNHGYHWEAHESWEALWHAPYDACQREHLQALVQIAAAGVQHRLGHVRGSARLAHRAASRLRQVQRERGDLYMGLHIPGTATSFEEFAFGGGELPILWLHV